ncbi:MAG TPA: hypothetical protein PLL77_05805 [Pyrinomonadaceae bacterium]|nr:hypothetical protein [Pyrinomonadaceae bacterium]
MKKQISSLAFLLLLSVCVSAQTTDRSVEKIRTFYTDIAEKARLCETDDDRGEFGELFMNELVVNKRNHQWRAVGRHVLTYRFFYQMTPGDREDHMYPDQLVMVKVERRISDRTYNEEYLYSAGGALIFYFQKSENDDQSPSERRVYFSGIKAIRIAEDGKTRDKLNTKDAATIKEITGESGKIKDVFTRSLKF